MIDYEKMMAIDPDALDRECLWQAANFYKIADAASRARAMMDSAKEALDAVRASVDMEVRRDPAKYGLEKTTEAMVANCVLLDPRHKAANEKYLAAKNEHDLMVVAVRAYDQRKDALEMLITLAKMNYFCTPAVPHETATMRTHPTVTERLAENRAARRK